MTDASVLDAGMCGALQPLCARDPFVPPFPLTGAPGWQQSEGEACFDVQGYVAASVTAATSTGVAALVATSVYDDPYPVESGWVVARNDGTGWNQIARVARVPEFPFYDSVLAVASNDDLFASQIEILNGPTNVTLCSVARIPDTGDTECWTHPGGSATIAISFDGIGGTWVLSETDVRTVRAGSLDLKFTLPAIDGFLPRDLWSDGTTTYVVGYGQTIVVHTAVDGVTLLPNVPAGDFVAVVGTSASDLYIGTSTGAVLHYDGATFTTIELPNRTCGLGDRVIDLFLDGTTLYYATPHSFGSIVAGGPADDLAAWSCTDSVKILGMSGNATTHEQFLALANPADQFRICGATHVAVHSASGFNLF